MSLVLLLVLAFAAPQQARDRSVPETPIAIEDAGIRLKRDTGLPFDSLAVTIRNVSARTIVAWGLQAQVRYSNATESPTSLAIDSYEYAVRTIRDSAVLPPGGVYTMSLRLNNVPGAEPAVAVPELLLAIFDDNTAVGDEIRIAGVFARRGLAARGFQQAERLLDEAMAGGVTSRVVLERLLTGLDAVDDKEVRNDSVFAELKMRIRPALASGAPTDQFLATLRQQLRARRENAEARSVRSYK